MSDEIIETNGAYEEYLSMKEKLTLTEEEQCLLSELLKNTINCECETTDLGFVVKHKCRFVDSIYCDKEKRVKTKEDFKNEQSESEV